MYKYFVISIALHVILSYELHFICFGYELMFNLTLVLLVPLLESDHCYSYFDSYLFRMFRFGIESYLCKFDLLHGTLCMSSHKLYSLPMFLTLFQIALCISCLCKSNPCDDLWRREDHIFYFFYVSFIFNTLLCTIQRLLRQNFM